MEIEYSMKKFCQHVEKECKGPKVSHRGTK